MPNKTLKILIPSNGLLNWDGVSKLNGMPKTHHATILRLDIKTHHIEFNLKVFICK